MSTGVSLRVVRVCLLFLLLWLSLPWPHLPGTRAASVALPHDSSAGGTAAAAPDVEPQRAQRLLEAINQARWQEARLPPLKGNPQLRSAAQRHCRHMAELNFFGHRGYDRSSPWDRIEASGYRDWILLAENIAAGYSSPEEVVRAWLDSPLHRDNLLHPDMTEAGIGYVYEIGDTHPGDSWGYGHYWTLDLGARDGVYPVVIEREAYTTTQRTVGLYLYGSGWAAEMRLSNDGLNWTAWQPFQSELTWSLSPGAGRHSVHVQLRDDQGNEALSVDEIVLFSSSLSGSGPDLDVRPNRLLFLLPKEGQGALTRSITVEANYDGERLRTWYASVDQRWLRLSRSAGIAPAQIAVSLTEESLLLEPDLYTATLSLRAHGDQLRIPVHLLVVPRMDRIHLPAVWIAR